MDKDTDLSPADGDGINEITSKLTTLLNGPEDEEENTQGNDPGPDDAPAEAPASEDEDGQGEQETAITAPNSWDAEAKAKFAKLPPDLQEFISAREQARDRQTSMKLQEAAEVRRAVEEQAASVTQLRSAYEQRLHAFARHLEATVPEEFRDIRSPADLVRLAEKDPALVTRFHAFQAQVSSVAQEMAQIEQQKAAELQEQRQAILAHEFEAISEKWPEFSDPQKGPEIRSQMTQYAKSLGFNDREIGSLADHRLVLLLRDAMRGQQAASAAAKAKQKVEAKPLPKVVRPGSGEQAGRAQIDRGGLRKIAQSGDQASITRALEKMLSS